MSILVKSKNFKNDQNVAKMGKNLKSMPAFFNFEAPNSKPIELKFGTAKVNVCIKRTEKTKY